MKKWFYEMVYRFVPVDFIFGSTSKIEGFVDLAVDATIASGTVITLGCGVGRETIYLAKKGFDVIGLDFSPTAIRKARRRAQAEGLDVKFVVDDLTGLQHTSGSYDLVMDFGALNDMNQSARDLYMKNVIPLTRPGGYYVMFCFDKMLPPDEVNRRFGENFTIETLHKGPESRFPGVLRLFSMRRKMVSS